jgi:hypothetical protein
MHMKEIYQKELDVLYAEYLAANGDEIAERNAMESILRLRRVIKSLDAHILYDV